MLRLLAIIALGFLIYYILKRAMVGEKGRPKSQSSRRTSGPVTELVRDPMCKTYLTKDRAIVFEENYFCSLECRDKFVTLKKKK